MPAPRCPVCDTPIPAEAGDRAECSSCGAKLERGDAGDWTVAGDAPAG